MAGAAGECVRDVLGDTQLTALHPLWLLRKVREAESGRGRGAEARWQEAQRESGWLREHHAGRLSPVSQPRAGGRAGCTQSTSARPGDRSASPGHLSKGT